MLGDRPKRRVNEREMWIKRSISPFLGDFLRLSAHGELFAALGGKVQKRGSALQAYGTTGEESVSVNRGRYCERLGQ